MLLLIAPRAMLGRAWRATLRRARTPFDEVGRPRLDLADPASIDRLDLRPYDTVINCAGWTDVDGAEEHEDRAMAVNGEGVGHLARRCAEAGKQLVHYSTDYVFSGRASRPYSIDHPLDPLGAYGRSKAAGELRIREAGPRHLIIRTSWLYAPWGNNFVRTMARMVRDRTQLRVVSDQTGRPTSAEHLAATTDRLLRARATGTLHVTDGGDCTWHQFAVAIAGLLHAECDIEPCTTQEFPRPAPRPAYSVLDLGPTEALVGRMPHWRDNLADVLGRLDPL